MTDPQRTFGTTPAAPTAEVWRTYTVGHLYTLDDNGVATYKTDADGAYVQRVVKVPLTLTMGKAQELAEAAQRVAIKAGHRMRKRLEKVTSADELDEDDPELMRVGMLLTEAVVAAVVGAETWKQIDGDPSLSSKDKGAFAAQVIDELGLFEVVQPDTPGQDPEDDPEDPPQPAG